MTTLVVDEIRDTHILTQEDTITTEFRTRLGAVRLNLLGNGTPAGDIRLDICKGGSLLDRIDLSVANIKAGVSQKLGNNDDYFHGHVLFKLNDTITLEKDDVWEMQVSGVNGYSFSDSDFMAWVKPHESFENTMNGDIPESPLTKAFGYQLWKYKR